MYLLCKDMADGAHPDRWRAVGALAADRRELRAFAAVHSAPAGDDAEAE